MTTTPRLFAEMHEYAEEHPEFGDEQVARAFRERLDGDPEAALWLLYRWLDVHHGEP